MEDTIKEKQKWVFVLCVTFSLWTALTVKQGFLVEGNTLKGDPEMPLGMATPLVKEAAKLLFSWLAMVEATVAILGFLGLITLQIRADNRRGGYNTITTRKEFLVIYDDWATESFLLRNAWFSGLMSRTCEVLIGFDILSLIHYGSQTIYIFQI